MTRPGNAVVPCINHHPGLAIDTWHKTRFCAISTNNKTCLNTNKDLARVSIPDYRPWPVYDRPCCAGRKRANRRQHLGERRFCLGPADPRRIAFRSSGSKHLATKITSSCRLMFRSPTRHKPYRSNSILTIWSVATSASRHPRISILIFRPARRAIQPILVMAPVSALTPTTSKNSHPKCRFAVPTCQCRLPISGNQPVTMVRP